MEMGPSVLRCSLYMKNKFLENLCIYSKQIYYGKIYNYGRREKKN